MSASTAMIEATVARLIERANVKSAYAAMQDGTFPLQIWTDVAEAGLPHLLCLEDAGGAGAGFDDAAEVARLFGAAGIPVPIVESMIGNWLLGLAGAEPGFAPITPLIDVTHPVPDFGNESIVTLSGVHLDVAWARHTDCLAIIKGRSGYRIGRIPVSADVVTARGANLAGEPRDTVDLARGTGSSVVWFDLPAGIDVSVILSRMALLRAALMVGAMERALQMSLAYTTDRSQFGRPLAQFQVIQQTLAVMATQVAAARSAVMTAAVQSDAERAMFMAAVAKARVGEAAGLVAAAAHQVHGAMGFTQEYGLGIATKRLWAWRREDGSESYWQEWLGARARAAGDIWPVIAA